MIKKKTPIRDYMKKIYRLYIAEYLCIFLGHKWKETPTLMNWVNEETPNHRCVCLRCNAHRGSVGLKRNKRRK